MCAKCHPIQVKTILLQIITSTQTQLTPKSENDTISYDECQHHQWNKMTSFRRSHTGSQKLPAVRLIFLRVVLLFFHEVSPFIIVKKFARNGHCTVSPHMNKSVVMWVLLWGLWMSLIEILTEALPAIITKCWGQQKWMWLLFLSTIGYDPNLISS